MEAATPLRPPSIRVLGDTLLVDGLRLDDPTAARLVREREEAGEDPAKLVADAVQIGARVLDREQAAANAEFVRTEFEKVSREVEVAFGDKAAGVIELFGTKVDEVFAPDSGSLFRALIRHFGDESSAAVQHRVKALVAEVMKDAREDMRRQFSSADGDNPLADFKRATLATLKGADERQALAQAALLEKLALLEREVQGLRDEREKQEELEAERERGTAKGRTFEEQVGEALDGLAAMLGDGCDAVGDTKGATRRTGDVVISIDGACGPGRGRIVFEAKNSKLSRPEALKELDRGLEERDADYAVLVVSSEEKVPARTPTLREFNGDKLIVAYDPAEGSRLGLEVAYKLARARVLMARGDEGGVDAAAIRETVERALQAMDDVRRVKSQLKGAETSIENAREIVDTMAGRVRALLAEIDAQLTAQPATDLPACRHSRTQRRSDRTDVARRDAAHFAAAWRSPTPRMDGGCRRGRTDRAGRAADSQPDGRRRDRRRWLRGYVDGLVAAGGRAGASRRDRRG